MAASSPALDRYSQAFVEVAAKEMEVPLHEQGHTAAREALERLQEHNPAEDVERPEIQVPFAEEGGEEYAVRTVIFRPRGGSKEGSGKLPIVFYMHGGGWILGSPESWESLAADLVRQTGAAVVFPVYSPAPEKQYPTQFEEVFAIFRHVLDHADELGLDSDSVALAGDGAGGHMAIALMQLIMHRELSVIISHLVLFYPLTDTHEKSTTAAYGTSKESPYMTPPTLDWMVSAFIPGPSNRHLALTSPLSYAADATLAKFPPTTIFAAAEDFLADEAASFGRRLENVGVDAAVLKAEGQVRDFAMLEMVRRSATAQAVVELAGLKLRRAIRRE